MKYSLLRKICHEYSLSVSFILAVDNSCKVSPLDRSYFYFFAQRINGRGPPNNASGLFLLFSPRA